MSEIKKQFTGGKMNKDVDERLVPTGEYRDAMNIQVSTSEGSDVGTIQNVLGNIPGCADFNSAIGDNAFTVGSISDEKNDTLYWLIAGRTEENLILPLSVGESVSFKDMIMSYNSSTGCTPVFVDKWKFCTGIDPNSSYYGSLTNSIVLDDTSLYSNITQGMFATGYNGPNTVWGPTLVNNVGIINTIPVNYQSETITTTVNSSPITDTAWINVRTFYELGCTGGSPNFNINGKNPCSPLQSQVSSTNIPPNTYGAQLWIHPSDWNPNIVVGSKVSATNLTNGLNMLNTSPPGAEVTAINFQQLCKNTNHPSIALGNMSGCINAYVLDIEPFIINGTPNSPYTGNLSAFTPSYTPAVFDSEYGAYKSFNGTITPPPYPVYTPTDVIHIAPNSSQWLNEIYDVFYDASGVLIPGAFLQINNNVGAGSSWPQNSCIDPITVSAPIAGIYDDTFNIINCSTGSPQNALNVNPNGRPLTFFTLPVFGTEAVILNDSVNMNGVDTVCFESDRVLNFDKDRLITGVNIIDDMLLWTDNFSEPKKINIGRGIQGTHTSGDTHTALVNLDAGYSLTNWYQPIREEHVTVIRKSPKNALSLELETGRDTSLNYTGITIVGIVGNPTSITAPITISDFSSIAIGDTISFNINSDYDSSLTFALAWQPGQFILLKEAPDTSNLPGTPLANWKIRGKILSEASNNFDSANGLPVNVTIEIVGLNGVPDDPDPNIGYLSYVVDIENSKSKIFEYKFPRFSYRYKYSDNEYSTFAPWSEVAFLPTTFNYDPKKGWNKGMVNNIKSIKISGFISSVWNLPTGKDIVEVDILYKEDSSPNVYLVETISPIDILQSGLSTIPWYSNEYIIDSETIKSTIASNQLLRPWDNVPKKALAQEVSGNRVIYGNYEQNYDLKVDGLKYKPNFTNSLIAWGEPAAGSPQKSIKSLRDYKLGVVFTDKYGRETPVIISESGGFKVDKQQSISANRLTVGLNGQPPAEMAYYKFYVKETSTEYYSIAMDRWYAAEDGNIWLAFPSADRNKIDLDTSLYLKKGKDNDSNVIENSSRYKVLAIENEAPEFIKTRKIRIGTVIHNAASSPTKQIFGVSGNGMALAPYVGGIPFSMDYNNGGFSSSTLSHLDEIKEPLYIQFYYNNDKSQQYKILQITSDRTINTIPNSYHVTLDKPLTEDVNFIFDNAVNPDHINDNVKVSFIKAVIENKPQFDGRFFVKIENDGNIRTQITDSETLLGTNYGLLTQKTVYLLENDEQLRLRSELAVIDNSFVPNDQYENHVTMDYMDKVLHASSPQWQIDYLNNISNWNYYVARSAYFGAVKDNNKDGDGRGWFDTQEYHGLNWSTNTSSQEYENQAPMRLKTGNNHLHQPGGNVPTNGVWFINKATRKYISNENTTGMGEDDLRWRGYGNMNEFSPDIAHWRASNSYDPINVHVGPGISEANKKMSIGFGPICASTDSQGFNRNLWTVPDDLFPGDEIWWYLKASDNKIANFFDISNTNTIYKDIHHNFQKSLQAGNSFIWREDPTNKLYTIDDQTSIKNHTRFGIADDGRRGMFHRTLGGSPSTYTKTWDFALDNPMDGWNPVNATYPPFIDSGLHLGRGEFLTKTLQTATTGQTTSIIISDITGIEIGMSVKNGDATNNFNNNTVVTGITPGNSGSGTITLSNSTAASTILATDPIFFGYTIFVVSSKIYGMGALTATVINENWIEVNRLSTACSNGNLGPRHELQKGMMLSSYNIDSTEQIPGKKNIIIKGIDPQNTSTGTYKIHLTGYKRPLHYQSPIYNALGAAPDHEFSVTTSTPISIAAGERLEFKQVVMNGVSNYTEANTYISGEGSLVGVGPNHKSGGIGAVGYEMQFVDIFQTDYGDGDIISEDPFVWETEPKDNTELDIYYEISENNPTVLNPDTINIAIPIGSKVASIAGAGGIPDDTYVLSVGGASGNQIVISELAWVGPGLNPTNLTLPLISGSTLEITKPNGVVLNVKIQNIVQMPTPPFTSSSIFELNPNLFNSEYKLNWHNCWSFGNGVESNRIKDTFNSPFIGHGVKVSTTSDDYKKEHRETGLIYSGLYNSTSGINNLNQFIQAEKITKDVNPTYGSIRKLYAGWGQGGDLIALCEDRVLKILANKDALYNADGNSNITSTNNVLGTATPFAGNYGISKNPESFASESFRAYFTDKVRGAVIRLSMDGLTAISDHGMKDWFRDNLKLNSKLVGSYDDKKDEYNITLQQTTEQTPKTVSFREDVRGWVSFKSFVPENAISCSNEYYTFLDGKLWRHHVEGTITNPHPRNTFYGPYPEHFTPTSLTAILNDVPGSVKSFNTINYEGSQSRVVQNLQDNEYYNLTSKDGWYIDSIFTDKEQGTIDEFIEKEGKWFNYIKGKEIQHFIGGSSNDPFTGIVLNDNGTSSLEQGSFAVQGIGTLSTSTSVLYSGCTDPTAFNYQPTAVVDDGSCIPIVYGCMEASASNYDSSVNTSIANHCQWSGCTDATAFNYTFFPPIAFTYNNGDNIIDNGLCVATVLGCVDATAFNYNASANTDDGTCLPFIYGCTDPTSFNYNSSANTADPNDPCEAVTLGCMDPTACNYSAFVNTDNGSCVYSNQPPAVACYETATFNSSLCTWLVTGSPVSIVITQSPPGVVCPNTSVTFQRNMFTSSVIGKQWNKNGIAIPGATATTYSTTDPGSYSLTLTDANGCASTSNSLDLINTIVNTPSGLFTSNIGLTSVTMNWSGVLNAHHYDIQFRTAGTSWPATPQFQNIPYTVESLLKSNLTGNTNYEWQIRSACSTNSNTDTAWSATQFVTTAAPCVVPTTPVTTGITTTTATLGWDVVSGAVGYKVRYKQVAQPYGSYIYVTVTTNSYALTALLSGTAYHWQVASMCDANGSNNSAYTGYTVFTTTTQ